MTINETQLNFLNSQKCFSYMKTILFVDGSNLYHSIQETGFKPNLIDYHKLFEKICNEKNPQVRFYITALTKDFSEKERSAQQSFFSSLKKNPNLSIFFGRLQKKQNFKLSTKSSN